MNNQDLAIQRKEQIKIKRLTIPYEYRADCKIGHFKRNDTILDKTLNIVLLSTIIEKNAVKFGNEQPKDWICLTFLDERYVESALWLHSSSFTEFVKFYEELIIIEEYAPIGLHIQLYFEKITSKSTGNTFYIVKPRLVDTKQPHCDDELLQAILNSGIQLEPPETKEIDISKACFGGEEIDLDSEPWNK